MNQKQTDITTGKQIRHLRTQSGMTQEELAGELNVTRQALDQLMARNGVTEQLKATNQMKWVRRMNAVRHEAAEIVAKELIYDEAT